MDGRFIEKNSSVDVVNGPNSFLRGTVTNITEDYMDIKYNEGGAVRIKTADISKTVRRAAKSAARLDTSRPDSYYDDDEDFGPPDATGQRLRNPGTGNLSAEEVAALPEQVTVEIDDVPVERKPSVSEAAAALKASTGGAAYQAKIDRFNSTVDDTESANKTGDPLAKNKNHNEIDFTGSASVADMFETIRGEQDPAFTRHQEFVAETLRAAGANGLNLEAAFRNEDEVWNPEAKAYMDALVEEMMAELVANGVGQNKRALMMGGLPGAGKTSLVEAYGLDMNKWAVVNPDVVKEKMIRDGVFPEIKGLSPTEMAGPMHEMSSDISKSFSARVLADGFDMIADITMGGHPKKRTGLTGAEGTAVELSELGYQLDAVFVDVPLSMSAVSQNQRHLNGVNRFRDSKVADTDGGRYVPEEILAGSDTGGPTTLNVYNFEKMRSEGRFARWYVVNNTDYDTTPVRIGAGAEDGRVPKYTKTLDARGRVSVTLEEPLDAIPGMYPGAEPVSI